MTIIVGADKRATELKATSVKKEYLSLETDTPFVLIMDSEIGFLYSLKTDITSTVKISGSNDEIFLNKTLIGENLEEALNYLLSGKEIYLEADANIELEIEIINLAERVETAEKTWSIDPNIVRSNEKIPLDICGEKGFKLKKVFYRALSGEMKGISLYKNSSELVEFDADLNFNQRLLSETFTAGDILYLSINDLGGSRLIGGFSYEF